MKKAVKVVVVMAMFISAAFANANESTFKINILGESKFRVEVTDVQGSSVAYIKNANGQVLYKEKSRDALLRMTFDFSKLAIGNYDLIIKDELKVRVLPVLVTKDGIEVNNSNLEKSFFPKIEKEDNTVLVKLLSDEGNDLLVSVWTPDGELLQKDKIEGKLGLIGRKYHFEPGSYAVTVESNDFIDTKYIMIK